jgi:hypothetical protein
MTPVVPMDIPDATRSEDKLVTMVPNICRQERKTVPGYTATETGRHSINMQLAGDLWKNADATMLDKQRSLKIMYDLYTRRE